MAKPSVGIYSPYLDTLGGGEKYVFDIAQILSREHDVTILWNDKSIIQKAQERFGLSLDGVQVGPPFFNKGMLQSLESRKYDAMFYVSDGSIPSLFSKKNFLIIQFPVNWVKTNPVTRIKLAKINSIICYSSFVKLYLLETFKKTIHVIPPLVDIKRDPAVKKENIILSVGRFTQGMNMKKQGFLIDAFKKMCDMGIKDWKLILVGGVRDEDKEYFENIKKLSQGFPIEVIGNSSLDQLHALNNKAKIYWHAAGAGEDLLAHPERAEHFGITTVEAMRCGAVPVVVNAGGQKEIVAPEDGYLWNTSDELVKFTLELIHDSKKWEELSNNSMKSSLRFNKENFSQSINNLLK